jgi:hypothetical protein
MLKGQTQSKGQQSLLWWLLAACVLSGCIYYSSISASLNSDDYLLGNDISHIPSVGSLFFRPIAVRTYYRPIHELILYLAGMQIVPLRLLSIAFHCLVVFMVMWAGKLIFERIPSMAGISNIGGGVAGLLFAVFPRQNETVIWIGTINHLVVAACFWGATISVLEYNKTKHRRWLVVLICGLVVGLLSKENIASFPAVAFLLQYLFPDVRQQGSKFLKRTLTNIVNPTVLITFCIVGTYMILRTLYIKGGIGGYGWSQSPGESQLKTLVQAGTNFIRYPILTPLAPLALFAETSKHVLSLVGIGAILTISLLMYRSHFFSTLLPEHESTLHIDKRIFIVLLFLFWATMLPTFQISPSFINNNGGRHLYIPAPWLAIGISLLFFLWCPIRIRMPLLFSVVGVYVILGICGSGEYCHAGEVSDRLITDYVQYCESHPRVTPLVVSTVSDIEGDAALFNYGLLEAITYKHLDVPKPNIPIVNISDFTSCDSVITERVSDSVLRITDRNPCSWIDVLNSPEVLRQISGFSFLSRSAVEITLSDSLRSIPCRQFLVVSHNRLIPIQSSMCQ